MKGAACDLAAVAHALAQGESSLLWERVVCDTLTPVAATLALMHGEEPCFLLESVHGGETRGRYSVIGLMPDMLWRSYGARAEICHDVAGGAFEPCSMPTMESLKLLLREIRMPIPAGLPPMAAGLIGYLGYDMIKQVEAIPTNAKEVIHVPDALLMRPGVTVVFDAVDGVVYLIAPIWKDDARVRAGEVQAAIEAARGRIATVMEALRKVPEVPMVSLPDAAHSLEFTPNMHPEQFYQMVEQGKEHIRAGDIFQIVLSQRLKAPFEHHPFTLYRALRYLNPSPFLFFLRLGEMALVGSSPEILVRVREGKITIRPLAGTRMRGATPAEDAALEQELLADPKEIAEHLMLLDLGRNDVGRCAKVGTVKVTEQMVVERYSHVMHIVSNVEGELDPRYDAVDALMSGFPAGTVSGAPKIRAMELIDALEPEARSFYAGCVGYFSADGGIDTCITLRTGLVKDGALYVQAGGGVVADSTPEGEYQESLNKAKALMRAAAMAGFFG